MQWLGTEHRSCIGTQYLIFLFLVVIQALNPHPAVGVKLTLVQDGPGGLDAVLNSVVFHDQDGVLTQRS